jgi:hypothetical protein
MKRVRINGIGITLIFVALYAVTITPLAWQEVRRQVIEWSLNQPEADMAMIQMQNEQLFDLPVKGAK